MTTSTLGGNYVPEPLQTKKSLECVRVGKWFQTLVVRSW